VDVQIVQWRDREGFARAAVFSVHLPKSLYFTSFGVSLGSYGSPILEIEVEKSTAFSLDLEGFIDLRRIRLNSSLDKQNMDFPTYEVAFPFFFHTFRSTHFEKQTANRVSWKE